MNILNGDDRVALLLSSLGSQAADGVLQQLSNEKKNRIRGLMQQRSQDSAPAELVDRLIRDLASNMSRSTAEPNPTLRVVRPTDHPAGGRETSAIPASRKSEHTESKPNIHPDANTDGGADDQAADPVAQLRALDEDRLAMGLEGEHPQTVATVINCLEPHAAGDLLKRLPPETRRLVFLRFGQHSSGPVDLVPRIVQAIVQKCHQLGELPLAEKGDAKYQRMAEVLKRLERTDRMELLAALNEQDSTTATMVKDRLYLFEDLRQVEDRSVQKLLAEIDSKTLATALTGAAEDIAEKVLNNLSKRGREMVTEEMSFLSHVSAAQVQQAQKAVVEVIQRLDQAGDLVMLPEG